MSNAPPAAPQVVFRYQLALDGGVQSIEMPLHAEIVKVAWRPSYNAINLWARVDERDAGLSGPVNVRRRSFRVVGTGHKGELLSTDQYLDSVFVRGDELVFHIFEVP